MIQIRIDDVRPHMTDEEHEALCILCAQNLFEVLLAFTPLWLEARELGKPDSYSQEAHTVQAREETIKVISDLLKQSNVRLGMHGLFHYYRITSYRKLRSGYLKNTRNFDPEWKHIESLAFERDIKVGSRIIESYFGIPPGFISPPSNALSRPARKYCEIEGIDLRCPRWPLVNDLLARHYFCGGRPTTLLWFMQEVYIPLYSEAAVDEFIESCHSSTLKDMSVVLLLHPWELPLVTYRNLINFLTGILLDHSDVRA